MNKGDSHVTKLVNLDWIQQMKYDLFESKYILKGQSVGDDNNENYLEFDNSSIYYKDPLSDILEIIVYEDNDKEKEPAYSFQSR